MKKFTILATPINAVGHVNATLGALKPLVKRGHRIIFILEDAFAGKASVHGFEEHLMTFKKEADEQNPGESIAKKLLDSKLLGNYTTEEKIIIMKEMFKSGKGQEEIGIYDDAVKEAIAKYEPDLIYCDNVNLVPSIYYSGIPWIKNMSAVPLFYVISEEIPPGCSGYSINTDIELVKKFNSHREAMFKSEKYNDYIETLGYKRFPNDVMMPDTQVMNVYAYPEELNFPYFHKLGWFNLEVFNKIPMTSQSTLQDYVSEKFVENDLNGNFSGKYIYISMGSMGSIDLDLMKRLVNVLSRTNHKYIVSKGPRHSEYELANNMYGERYLPQTKLLPLVDLVITHGGNNTTTETFGVGKPMIVMPLFCDQFDNAQRLEDTGLGAQIHPYNYKDEDLIETIDRLLNDKQLQSRLISAAKRIHSIDKHEELADKIEELLSNK